MCMAAQERGTGHGDHLGFEPWRIRRAPHDRIESTVTLIPDSSDAIIVEELRRAVEGLVAAYRFGSTAQDAATRSSDIDIGVLARHPLAPAVRFDLQERLAARLGRDIDLVDLPNASRSWRCRWLAVAECCTSGTPMARIASKRR